MKGALVLVALLICGCAGLLLAGRLGLLSGGTPSDLGVRDGRLKPPSVTRNSVSSQADRHREAPQRRYAMIAPLRYDGEPARAMERLVAVLAAWPDAVIVEQRPDYLYAQFTTRWLRFVDDVEFLLDAGGGVIHVRSASRLGREDLGTNRRRVEAIRAAFDET